MNVGKANFSMRIINHEVSMRCSEMAEFVGSTHHSVSSNDAIHGIDQLSNLPANKKFKCIRIMFYYESLQSHFYGSEPTFWQPMPL